MANEKVALITGANRGIGLETARQLGKEGFTVLLGVRDLAKGQEAASQLSAEGVHAEPLTVDMNDPSTFAPAAQHIESRYGKLDVLVNNAGIGAEGDGPAKDADVAAVRAIFEVNFFNLVSLTQTLLPLLRKAPAARIVNLSSILGSLTLNADPNSPIGDWRRLGYNSSKTALNAFTAILSVDLKDTPIKVNSAHPGWVKTDMGGPDAHLEIVDGAKTSVWLATLPEDGPTGGYFHMQDRLPW